MIFLLRALYSLKAFLAWSKNSKEGWFQSLITFKIVFDKLLSSFEFIGRTPNDWEAISWRSSQPLFIFWLRFLFSVLRPVINIVWSAEVTSTKPTLSSQMARMLKQHGFLALQRDLLQWMQLVFIWSHHLSRKQTKILVVCVAIYPRSACMLTKDHVK